MKIVALTDIHGQTGSFSFLESELKTADVLLICGDITNFGGAADAEEVLAEIQPLCKSVLAVSGNCDRPSVSRLLAERKISLEGTVRVVDGVAFCGIGGSLPCPGKTPNEHSEAEFRRQLCDMQTNLPAGMPLVFVSHQPPADTGADLLAGGPHVGSEAVREFIVTAKPCLCFTGHIHEAAGEHRLEQTAVLNPGLWREQSYAVAEISGGALRTSEIRMLT